MATDLPQPSETAEDSEEQSSRVQLWPVVLAVLVLGGAVEVIIYGYLERPGWIGSSGKQFWDYLDLLIVPAALALGVYWLNWRQTEREQRAEDAQQERALAVESQRAQDEALQAYLDVMSQLLTDEKRPLRRAQMGDSLSSVARARTLTVLSRLDGERKGTVVRFLYESGLIGGIKLVEPRGKAMERAGCIVDLRDAELSSAVLTEAVLSGAALKGVTLRHADLRGASLSNADLRGTSLNRANLGGANLVGASLRGLDSDAPDSYPPVDRTRNVDLRAADLKGAILLGADLRGADLRYADLTGADLVHPRAEPGGILAEMEGGFGGREGGAKVLLEYFTGYLNPATNQSGLRGTILPDGQRYEAWLEAPGTADVLEDLDKAREKYRSKNYELGDSGRDT